MNEHLSTRHVKQLSVSALPEHELVAAAIHTSECQSCHQRFVEELRRQRGSAEFSFSLEPEFVFRNEHVNFDQLVSLADRTLDQTTEEIVNIHLETCETCREDVRSFLAFRDATAGEMDITYGPPEYQTNHGLPPAIWWQRLPSRPVYAVAAIVLVVVALLIGVIALKRSGPLEASKQAQITPNVERNPGNSPAVAPEVVPVSPRASEATTFAVVIDSFGPVTIDESGRVTGIDELSEDTRQHIARAVLSEQVDPADVLEDLSGEQSGSHATENSALKFILLYPVRRVVIEDRPVFRWETLPGVSSYQVYVFDADGNQVAQSEGLPPAQTHWKARPLRRGQIFSWNVTAIVNGKKIVSPSASGPGARFAVLSVADFQELDRLKKTKSHLALGVFYARTGLLDEAEDEFQSLIKLNPDSELPKKLLQSVRSIRNAN